MRQWIRWWGLGVFVAILLLLWLGTDPLIKWSIESAGTQAVGAKVELGSVDLGLDPVTLNLNRLQVTDPNAPMRNLVEAGHIRMSLDGYALLRRQFIAENMAVEGLRFDTKRSRSGAIEGRLFSRKKNKGEGKGTDLGAMLPGLELPDPNKIVARERDQLNARVDKIDSQARGIVQSWNEKIKNLPSADSVKAYRQRWQELQNKDPLSRIAGARKLKNDIGKDLDTVRNLDKQLKQDRQKLQSLTQQARNLPGEEADRLMGASGLDQGFQGVTRKLLGDKVSLWVDRGLTGYRLVSEQMAGRKAKKEAEAKPPRGKGQYIRFPEKQPLPGFLIKRAAVDGTANMAGSAVDFSGSLRNITHQPAIWGKPLTLDIQGQAKGGTALTAKGTFDHTGEPGKDRLNFTIKQLTLKDATFSGSDKLPIVLKQGQANIDGAVSVTDGQLDASVKTRVTQARFQAGGKDTSDIARRLAGAIEGVSDFNLNLALTGTLSSPKIRVDSNLDRIIGQALGAEARKKLADARKKVEARIREQLGPKLNAIADRGQALDQYRKQIEQRREALRNIGP